MTTKRRSQLIAALRKAHLHAVRSLYAIRRELRLAERNGNAGSPGDSPLDQETLVAEGLELQSRKRLIEAALRRVGDGGYGVCTSGCGKEIDQQRLLLLPWAEFCISCQNNSDIVGVAQCVASSGSDGNGKSGIIRLAS